MASDDKPQTSSESRRLEHDLRLLARAGSELDAILDPQQALSRAARVVVPEIADLCMIDLVDAVGEVERPVIVFADAGKAPLADELREFAPRGGADTAQARVLRSGQPLLLPDFDERVVRELVHSERHAASKRDAGVCSEMVVPLISRGSVLGALTLAAAESGRRYTEGNLELAEALASRIASAIDNARLLAHARHAIAARDAMLAIVAHDLRSPLSVVALYAESLRRQLAADHPETTMPFESMQRGLDQMARLIQDLLDAACIERGVFVVERSRTSLAELVVATVEMFQAQAHAASISLGCELPQDDALEVAIDYRRVCQVLANLLGNALKFTPRHGRIAVRARREGTDVHVSVSDTGCGIPPAARARVFERYWRDRERPQQGAGLGLAIAKGIVDAHGGRIWIESEVGVGTTLHVALPCKPAVTAVH